MAFELYSKNLILSIALQLKTFRVMQHTQLGGSHKM